MSGAGGRLSLAANVSSGRDEYHFRTADGVRSPDQFRDAELLLLETLWDRNLDDVLVVQANYGVVGTVLAARPGSVRMTETSARAARLCRSNVAENGVSATVSLVESPRAIPGSVDTACYAPAGYTPMALRRQRVVDALSVVGPGGRLYVAARPGTGLERFRSLLGEHCPAVETVGERDALEVVAATRPEEFEPPEYVATHTIETTVDGVDLSLVSAPGLFSADDLDHGTRLLLETAEVHDGETVLDLACGYGPVGAYAASVAESDVVLSDDDVRATACARQSLDATGVDGTVVTGDGTRAVDRRVDRVLCNPPTHAGDGVLSDLFGGVSSILNAGGTLSVVHHRTLDLDGHLRSVGSIVDRHTGEEHTVVTVKS